MRSVIPALFFALCACGPREVGGTQVKMDFTRPHFWDAPFPSDDRVDSSGRADVSQFGAHDVPLVQQIAQLVNGADGFATSAGVFFPLTDAVDPAGLPDLAGSVAPGSPVFLLEVDGPEPGRRMPFESAFTGPRTPYGAANLLTVLPLQGVPLRPRTTYAAGVLRSLRDARGRELGVSLTMAELAAGRAPAGLLHGLARYQAALDLLGREKVDLSSLAGLAVFTTGAPVDELGAFRADVLARPLPVPDAPFALTEVFPRYCVFESRIAMPEYQRGNPPYSQTGGDWATDEAGHPALQRYEDARIVITLPRSPMPAAGYPVVNFIRSGGGGDRPLVDRGTQAQNGGPALIPGSGPALYFAQAGFAAFSVDGPLGGLRNPTGGDEDFLIFNPTNLFAMRDNIRQSALELVLQAHLIASGSIQPDATQCPGATGPVRFDTAHLALMGHSMGATILPLAAAWEPSYGALVLSGAGASEIENVAYKQKPLQLKPFVELLVGEPLGSMTQFDPVLSLAQWAGESADPQVYDDLLVREPAAGQAPRHVLMEQGIVDHYILPRIANATSLSLGLDLGGAPLDDDPSYVGQLQAAQVLPLVGRGRIPLPASGNLGGATTAVLVQNPGDGVEDGHEVVFQTDAPKYRYKCFLQSWLTGTPVVTEGAAADAPCP